MLLNVLIIFFVVISLYKIRLVSPISTFNNEYLSIKSCNSYRGFFAVVVILHHISQRVSGGALISDFTRVGYLAVSVFFFLSGYGLQKKNLKDVSYSRGFLQKRIPTILVPYIIMSVIYWAVYALLGDVRSFVTVWNNFIKNGDPIVWFSWYIVCILVFYFVFFVLMKIVGKNRTGMILGGIVYYALYVFICRKLQFGLWWYSTALLLVLGVFWASYESQILKFIKRAYFILLPVCWILFVVLGKYKWDIYWQNPSIWTELALTLVLALLFVLGVILLWLKLNFGNKVLDFLGKISFEIYMVQGLIMLLSRNDLWRIENDFLWAVVVIFGSTISAFLLNKLFGFILKNNKKATT